MVVLSSAESKKYQVLNNNDNYTTPCHTAPNKKMLSKCCFYININFYVFMFLTFIFLVFVEKNWFSVLVTMCRPCEQSNTPRWVRVCVHSVIVEYDSRETCWSCTPMTMRHIITRSGGVFESNTFRLRLNGSVGNSFCVYLFISQTITVITFRLHFGYFVLKVYTLALVDVNLWLASGYELL